MADWDKLTAAAETALTLDEAARRAFIASFDQDPEAAKRIRRLLSRARAPQGFMATKLGDNDAAAADLAAGETVGRWLIRDSLGAGGMGQVYRAERNDGQYQQTVALKVMRAADPVQVDRFSQERQRLAMLEHPGISRLIDGGVTKDGRPFMAMEYIDGSPIDEYAKTHSLKVPQRLRLFVQLCTALSYAHGRLMLHRDIKPANVLVDSGGHVKLIDFGVALDLSADASSGGPLTLAYAAPEQLMDSTLTVATDTHGLGMLLHRLIAGTLPARNSDASVRIDETGVSDPDIFAILSRALARDPADRYGSVDAMADDIRATLEYRPVVARNGGAGYRLRRLTRRYPATSTLAFGLLLTLSAGIAISATLAKRAQLEAERAQSSLARAEFYLDRANLFFSTQNAYADALQLMFAGAEDTDAQTEALRERWREAFDRRAEDPNNAAYLSHAIGRHFLFRNDYPTAIEILQSWVAEPFGPDALVEYGRQLLAVAYMNAGREQDALPLLRRVESWLASGYDAGSPDHVAAAAQIATVSRATEDVSRADVLLTRGIEVEQNPQVKMFYWQQLSSLRERSGDFGGAHRAARATVELIEDNPLMEFGGVDTAWLNLAGLELYFAGDVEAARALAEAVIDQSRIRKGESRESGRAREILATVALAGADYQTAVSESAMAVELTTRYATAQSVASLNASATHVEALAAAGRFDDASDALKELKARFADANEDESVRIALAEAYLVYHASGPNTAKAWLNARRPSQSQINNSALVSFLWQRLLDEDVAHELKRASDRLEPPITPAS